MNKSSWFHAYRQLRHTFPYREQRRCFLCLGGGPSSLFIWKERLARWEINSVEFTQRLMVL